MSQSKYIYFSTTEELVRFCLENDIQKGKIYVKHAVFGQGEEQTLHFIIDDEHCLNTCIHNQDNIDGVNYASNRWMYYKEGFYLLLEN